MKKILVGLWLALTAFSASAQDVAKCLTNPESCLTAPIAKACPAGQKWSTAGSGIAHCVNVDPVCPSAEKVSYDFLGNPSCVARCSAGEYWNGASCSPCTTNSTASGSCQAGYNGTAYRSVTTNSCTGSTTYGNWDYSQCVVACSTNSWSESAACPAGYNGTMSRTNTTNSCTGTSYGAWNTSGCSVACTNNSWTEAGACQANYVGTAYRSVTVNSCSGSATYGPWNYANCSYSPTCSGGQTWNGSSCVCPSGQTWNGSSCATSCMIGVGSTSRGEPGYCTDCDEVPWVDGPFAANKTAVQRQCWSKYNTQEPPIY